ncbi:MAG: DNA-binding protein, partial [Bacteroidota bacterium]
ALRATLFFRDVLTESTAYYPRFEEKEASDQVALMRRVNEFMNEVQLTIAQAYEAETPDA